MVLLREGQICRPVKIGKYISILNRQSQKYLHHLVEQYGIGYSSYYFVMYIWGQSKVQPERDVRFHGHGSGNGDERVCAASRKVDI